MLYRTNRWTCDLKHIKPTLFIFNFTSATFVKWISFVWCYLYPWLPVRCGCEVKHRSPILFDSGN